MQDGLYDKEEDEETSVGKNVRELLSVRSHFFFGRKFTTGYACCCCDEW